ncbi:SCO6745 family protein [Actinophytocola xanthii]|uniref:SalK n=1 Tax=Actinophytocola xanthii TaxID=1912961 RepID=A0A1Q8CKM0_9PSEU|nr:hypothetical protein [Actinophytocola xanthii]OLF14893.1 hypothetical protein BU204_24440 [Actinophytocola xanthii]
MHPARRLWASLEPLHDVVYFAPTVRDTGKTLGLRGFWMTYFAFRAAPLGAVGPGPVLATFAGFEPSMVAKALPDAWTRTTPAACLAARLEVSAAALRGLVDEQACGEVVPVLAPVLAAADPTGRPLYAANAGLPLPADEVGALWQLATTLREHRGDGHVAALVANGVTGLEALLLQTGAGTFPDEVLRTVRGWSEQWWSAAAAGLRERDLLTGDGALTSVGRALLDDVEARTDAASWNGCLAALGEEGARRLVEVLAPSVEAVWSSGILPEVNPTGLRRQSA